MTYRALMKKIDAGEAEVQKWAFLCEGDSMFVVATFFRGLRAGVTKMVEVTKVPAEVLQGGEER